VLGYSLGASITEFYAACGGVRLIWTPVDPDEDGIWTAERAARVFAEPSKCGPWLFKSGDHVGTPQGCIWIPSCKQVFGNPAQWSDLLGSQDDVFDDYREQLGQPDAAECLAPFDYASAFYDFAFLLNGKPMWKPGGGTRAHRRARNCWASMSAWAVPLRQGALKETRTRPSGTAVTAPEGEGRAQEVAADSLELLAVATVGGGRCVEIHAEGRHGHRRRRCGLGAGREMRAGERELHAGGQRGVDVARAAARARRGRGRRGSADIAVARRRARPPSAAPRASSASRRPRPCGRARGILHGARAPPAPPPPGQPCCSPDHAPHRRRAHPPAPLAVATALLGPIAVCFPMPRLTRASPRAHDLADLSRPRSPLLTWPLRTHPRAQILTSKPLSAPSPLRARTHRGCGDHTIGATGRDDRLFTPPNQLPHRTARIDRRRAERD